MISALHVVLLLLMAGDVLAVSARQIDHDTEGLITKGKTLRAAGCQCMKSQNAEGGIDVTSISNRIGTSREKRLCSCSHDLSLHQQAIIATYKSRLAYLSTCAHRLLHSLSARIILASPQEPMKHHSDSKISWPLYNLRSKHDHFVGSPPPRGVHSMAPQVSARVPHYETMIPAASSAPGPLSHTSHDGRRHHGHHKVSVVPSPPPALGPMAAKSPTSRHPLITISPTPDCGDVVCESPLTNALFVPRCGCVQPILVELELSVPFSSLFPIIYVLAGELAEGALLSPSQVEIIGASVSGRNQAFSIIDANLLPIQEDFDIVTATIIAQKLWEHDLILNRTLFGNYTVIYVKYPGLPPPPPTHGQVSGMAGIQKPFGVDVSKPKKAKLGTRTTAAIVSAIVAMAICFGAVWLIFWKCRWVVTAPTFMPNSTSKKKILRGACSLSSTDHGGFTSISFPSSAITCASTARLFTIAELDRATNRFAPENIIGEGGFGRVFRGVLDDGSDVAVKVLTRRDNPQGSKEFLAEVEILSRIHHRNLVTLIGICTEEHTRCLVFELIPNGSVEFHLHDKSTCALNWEIRLKIALGAARGLAYLHEDSSPRVIHRDFKSANILLDNDFNPKVSDFGLAKASPDGGNEHLSTRVMGTFGYVAPEYAMTGHLLVKSDVYSYGVVLLELLSGRKPVDMSQPPGQEHLVTWARPLLTSMEGLQVLVDPTLKDSVSYDSLAKFAAIASMCVHSEVSDRPFMGEVVQALKLVCNDWEANNRTDFSECGQVDGSLDKDLQSGQHSLGSRKSVAMDGASSMSINYDSELSQEELLISPSALFCDTGRFTHVHPSSSRQHSLSVPLTPHRHNNCADTGAGIRGSISEPLSLDVRYTIRQNDDASCHQMVRSLDFSL